jgi:hypothetical protein
MLPGAGTQPSASVQPSHRAPAAVLRIAAPSDLRAHSTDPAHERHQATWPGRPEPLPANPPWYSMFQGRPGYCRPASARDLSLHRLKTVCRSLEPLLMLSVPRSRQQSVSRHPSQSPVAHRPSIARYISVHIYWGVNIYYQYAKYKACTILHIDFGICILFCMLMHIYAK